MCFFSKNGNKTKITGIKDQLITRNESNTTLNSTHLVQYFPENVEIEFKSNEDVIFYLFGNDTSIIAYIYV